jgi:hypothetical protein
VDCVSIGLTGFDFGVLKFRIASAAPSWHRRCHPTALLHVHRIPYLCGFKRLRVSFDICFLSGERCHTYSAMYGILLNGGRALAQYR